MARENLGQRRERAEEILRRLDAKYPETEISLDFGDAFQLLVSVILSAQCTDARVNVVTGDLFKAYRTPRDFATCDIKDLERRIRSTGFFRAKARNLQGCARALVERFGGKVPQTMDELVSLPGVGRKTANVVLWNAFGKREGIAVDTHVTRVSNLLRLTRSRNPEQIERDLCKVVPREAWGRWTHVVIDHGRAVCIANRPRCERCVLNELCPSARRPRSQ